MFKSATFRLTIYYLAIVAVISISFSMALYQVVAHDLAYGLQQQTQRISDNFPVFTDSPYLRMSSDIQAGRQHLIGRLVVLNIVVLALAGIASYALARRTLQPIEAAHERQKRFTADVSHELRTPLTALKMESEVALLDPRTPKSELRNIITSNIEEAEKLTLLITNLLRLSQLDDGIQQQAFRSITIGQPLQTAIDQVMPIAHSHTVTVNVNNSAASAQIDGDDTMLTQLFVILLDNALKYSSPAATVSVTAKAQGEQVVVTIVDSGKGIAKADMKHVFERFYRADAARTDGAQHGYGLGLSIARMIADAHHGTISLTSRLGHGTTATVFLPLTTTVASPTVKQGPAPTPAT